MRSTGRGWIASGLRGGAGSDSIRRGSHTVSSAAAAALGGRIYYIGGQSIGVGCSGVELARHAGQRHHRFGGTQGLTSDSRCGTVGGFMMMPEGVEHDSIEDVDSDGPFAGVRPKARGGGTTDDGEVLLVIGKSVCPVHRSDDGLHLRRRPRPRQGGENIRASKDVRNKASTRVLTSMIQVAPASRQ